MEEKGTKRRRKNQPMEPNRLGKFGENLFATLIMEPWDRADAFFAPTFLEGKLSGHK